MVSCIALYDCYNYYLSDIADFSCVAYSSLVDHDGRIKMFNVHNHFLNLLIFFRQMLFIYSKVNKCCYLLMYFL